MTAVDSGQARVGTEVVLGPVEDIPLDEGRAYDAAGVQVAVFRRRDGSLAAVSAVCPHKGGPIADGQIDAQVVLCPLHANVFELDTGVCRTAELRLATYPVSQRDGQVVVVV